MTQYNKLVRDNIPEIIKSKGEHCSFHFADDSEYEEKLIEKVVEEAIDVKSKCTIEEIADLFEVLDALIKHKKFDRPEIEKVKKEKLEKRGGFTQRIILEES